MDFSPESPDFYAMLKQGGSAGSFAMLPQFNSETSLQDILKKDHSIETGAEVPTMPSPRDNAAVPVRRISSLDVLHAYFNNNTTTTTTPSSPHAADVAGGRLPFYDASMTAAAAVSTALPLMPNTAATFPAHDSSLVGLPASAIFTGASPPFHTLMNHHPSALPLPPHMMSSMTYYANSTAATAATTAAPTAATTAVGLQSSVPTSAVGGSGGIGDGTNSDSGHDDSPMPAAAAGAAVDNSGDEEEGEGEGEGEDGSALPAFVTKKRPRTAGNGPRGGRRPVSAATNGTKAAAAAAADDAVEDAAAGGTNTNAPTESKSTTIQQQRVRKERRMLSNRESARRSRLRKQQHLVEIQETLNKVVAENEQLIAQVAKLEREAAQRKAVENHLRKENDALRVQLGNDNSKRV